MKGAGLIFGKGRIFFFLKSNIYIYIRLVKLNRLRKEAKSNLFRLKLCLFVKEVRLGQATGSVRSPNLFLSLLTCYRNWF